MTDIVADLQDRATLAGSDARVLVDFDHSLFAANSTELFIASCQPSLLAAVVDFLIRRCIPWRLTGIEKWYRLRDYVCVVVLVLLMPWNVLLWQRKAPRIFADKQSALVGDMVRDVDPARIVILSFGMAFVIRALVRGSRFHDVRTIATPFITEFAWFRQGKVEIANRALGDGVAARASFITDSEDDRDLLDYCTQGTLVACQGEPQLARERLYLPLRYSGSVKFTRSFAIDQWIFVDSALYALCVAHGFNSLLHMLFIAPILSLSFMSVYELGYFENDMVAARGEAKPVLSGKEARYKDYPIHVQSWIWALLLAVAAFSLSVVLGEMTVDFAPRAMLLWAGLLIACRLLFRLYNRLPTGSRLFAYPTLQISKYCSIMLVLTPTLVGTLLAVAQVTTMWVNYIAYRLGGDNRKYPKEPFRGVFFLGIVGIIGLSGVFAAATAPGTIMSGDESFAFGAIVCWCLLRIFKAQIMQRLKRG